MSKQQFPFVCQIKGTTQKLQPIMVDYLLQKVLINKVRQVQWKGEFHPEHEIEWYAFADLTFFPNHDFSLPGHSNLRDFILDSEIEFKENKELLEEENEDKSANYWAGAHKAIQLLKEKIYNT